MEDKLIDVSALDAIVGICYAQVSGERQERLVADRELRDWIAKPDVWLQVPHILNTTTSTHTKFFALQVLEGVVKNRWKALSGQQRVDTKMYVSQLIDKFSEDKESFRSERLYVNKLNVILVQIVMKEPPHLVRMFIIDLVKRARGKDNILTENCMAVLKLLSEEVFHFSIGEITQSQITELKECLTKESQLICVLCINILSDLERRVLIPSTLSALHACLSCKSFPHISDSALVETLLQLFSQEAHRNLVLQCLSEVATSTPRDLYNLQYVNLFSKFIKKLQGILPLDTDFAMTYSTGTREYQAFIQNLALFFTSFFKLHIRILETAPENISLLHTGLEYLARISYADEVFEVCLVYWNSLVSELCRPHHHFARIPSLFEFFVKYFHILRCGSTKRQKLYSPSMSELRLVMLSRMAKPEEAIIVEEENYSIYHLQYKLMQNTLINLIHLDHSDTKEKMLGKLNGLINELSSKLSTISSCDDESRVYKLPWVELNALCYAIGSICGSMTTEQENWVLNTVISDLCDLCKRAKRSEDKFVILTNVMHVIGENPRFLSNSRVLFKPISLWLFNFLRKSRPGTKVIACKTIFKIAQHCKHDFVNIPEGESVSFLSEILQEFTVSIEKLKPHQFYTIYESVGCMIQAESIPRKRADYLEKLMDIPNKEWTAIRENIVIHPDFLIDPQVIVTVLEILQINMSVSRSLGTYFLSQFSWIFSDMLDVYRLVSSNIATGGPLALRKELRSVKREILKLIETFLEADYKPKYVKRFVQPMMDLVLHDYARSDPDARESEVLSLFRTLINKYKVVMQDLVPEVFQYVLQPLESLEVITKNFETEVEHGVYYLALLCDLVTFGGDYDLIGLSIEKLKLLMDLVIWAIRNLERNIAKSGLNLLLEMLKKNQKCNLFFKTFFMQINQVESRYLTEPLWDTPQPGQNNAGFFRDSTINLLRSFYPNMDPLEVTQLVNGLYESRNDLGRFKDLIGDFLIQSKDFLVQSEDF